MAPIVCHCCFSEARFTHRWYTSRYKEICSIDSQVRLNLLNKGNYPCSLNILNPSLSGMKPTKDPSQ